MTGVFDVFTVSFFGHRQIDRFFDAEEKVAAIVRRLITEKEYVELLIGVMVNSTRLSPPR